LLETLIQVQNNVTDSGNGIEESAENQQEKKQIDKFTQYKNESEMVLYKYGWKLSVGCDNHKPNMSHLGNVVCF
jgi:hypothetical protein